MISYPVLSGKIDVNQVEDGYVIYQHDKDRVHYLNHTAVVLLELCTGKNEIDTIAKIFQEIFSLPETSEQEVTDCLQSLLDEEIIVKKHPR